MIQILIVALIVAAAAFYAFFQLAPRGLRASAAKLVLSGAERLGVGRTARARLEQRLLPKDACGACSNCGPEESVVQAGSHPASQPGHAKPLLFVRDPGKGPNSGR